MPEEEFQYDENSQSTAIVSQDHIKQPSYYNLSERNVQSEEHPLLFLDVTLGSGVQTRITLFEGEDHQNTVETFCRENCLSDKKK